MTTPVLLMVATPVDTELHTPPPAMSLKVSVEPAQTDEVLGTKFMVTTIDATAVPHAVVTE